MTNAQFAKENKEFIAACKAVEIPATSRQASRWRNKKGKAYRSFKNGESNGL